MQPSTSEIDVAAQNRSLSPSASTSSMSPVRETAASSSNSNEGTIRKSPSFSYTPYSKSPHLLSHSDSTGSFGTPPRVRSPSPYLPERDSMRDELMGVLMAFRACDPADLTSKLHLGSQVHRLLIEGSTTTHIKDDFCDAGGFLVIVQMLSTLDQTAATPDVDETTKSGEDYERLRVEIYKLALTILNEACYHHRRNAATFESTIGWTSFASVLKLSGIFQSSPECLFAGLLGLALADVGANISRFRSLELDGHDVDAAASASDSPRESEHLHGDSVRYAGALTTLVILLDELPVSESLHLHVLAVLERLASTSRRNQTRMAKMRIASLLLKARKEDTPFLIQAARLRIMERLYQRGLPTQDCRKILRLIDVDLTGPYLDMLRNVASSSTLPNLITFDMRQRGHSSIAMSDLPRPFPPSSASKGFSFFAPIMIERIEPAVPLDLLHLFDSHRTCTVKIEVEPGTGQITYSTSRDIPAIRFHKSRVVPGRLHHICLSHARPTGDIKAMSTVQLFIDGYFVQEEKAPWPANPPPSSTMRAVFGTPPLEKLQPKGTNRLIWSLGPAYLLDDVLPTEIPLVIAQLASVGYCGNFQDSLGRFLTYPISARINLRLDGLARSQAAADREMSHHPLVQVITESARNFFKEDRFYFIFNSANHYDLEKISRRSTSSLRGASVDRAQRPSSELLLNQAVTLTKDAIETSYGYAKLFGSPVLAPAHSVADTIWKLGGCAILLRLVALSNTSITLEKSLAFLFDLIQSSWRLSEDMERSKGYEILNYLLAQRKSLITKPIFDILTSAVGYTAGEATEAALVNPFLYRVILLDFGIWLKTSVDVRHAHLDQFVAFLKMSKHRKFNIQRAAKMQITRKLLQALQVITSEQPDEYVMETLDKVLSALRTSLVGSFNDTAIRSISSYLASQLCSSSPSSTSSDLSIANPKKPRRQKTVTEGDVSPDTLLVPLPTPDTGPQQQQAQSSPVETALRVFDMLTNLVLERPAFLLKLGSAVNIKWLLIFFGSASDKRAASLSLDIMTALLIRDKRYSERLAKSGGVKVIERLLPRFWNYPRIFNRCWSTLFDVDEQPGSVPLYAQFAPQDRHQRIICPLMLRLIFSCLGAGLHAIDSTAAKKEQFRPRPSDFLNISSKSKQAHERQRSRSMNMDTTELVQAFQASSEVQLLRDNVRLIEEHAQKNMSFCDLLFAPALLRPIVAALTPHVSLREDGKTGRPSEATDLANRLLHVLANSAVESITTSGSTKVISAILDAVPPDSDLSTATKFRLSLLDRIAAAVEDIIIPGLGDVLDDTVRAALADFIEQCSDEMKISRSLHLTAKVLTAFSSTRPSKTITAALLTSLDRIILFRLAAEVMDTYHQIIEHNEVIFMDANQDTAFFQCLLHNVLCVLHGKVNSSGEEMQMACYNVLILLARARPALVESIIIPEKTLDDFRQVVEVNKAALMLMGAGEEGVPFSAEWQGFTKSRDSLRAAIHLDRMSQVTQSLLSSDQKQKAVKSTESKMMAWQKIVRSDEEVRLRKISMDAKEMSNFAAGEWAKMLAELQRERAVLGKLSEVGRVFELDPTEGPMRMRPKLKEMARSRQEQLHQLDVVAESTDKPIIVHGDEWASGDMSLEVEGETSGEVADKEKEEAKVEEPVSSSRDETAAVDSHGEKFRRITRSLEKGDVIQGAENSLRVMFIECRASLLVFGKKCFYIIDDYFQRPDGELCNLWEAPEEERDTIVMSTLDTDGKGRQSLIEQLEVNAQQTRKWAWSDLKFVALKTFLHRKTAVEIHFKDGQSLLLVLATMTIADNVYRELASRSKSAAQAFSSLTDSLREASSNTESRGFSRLAGAVLGRGAGSITQRWIDRKMSNFEYLMCLNTAAGRTYQDITQYPVMPWILRDYWSESLDLENPDSYRNLALPMGAQQEGRRKQFEERYKQLQELESIDPDATKPFHYGTHYSTAATVSGYLIRLRPFDKILTALQGGSFDLADRTFRSIGHAYSSASEGSLGDVRELIPEAFYLPEFLMNSNRFEFGTTQSGVQVDDVELPSWANGDPALFIKLHRQALESDYVSMHLHSWIDLIFGYKQRGPAAVEATNCFHELSYEDGVDIQALDSSMEQQAVLKTIHMFGVCPRKLFNHPHPQRRPLSSMKERLTITKDARLLSESIAPIRTLHAPVSFIYASNPTRAFASPKDYLILPHLGLSLSMGHLDGSIRFFAKENMNVVRNVVEQIMPDRISAIVDASSVSENDTSSSEGKILVAGVDGTLTAWRVDGPRRSLSFLYSCRGHMDTILCLESSQPWNLVVSGSQDGSAIIWDGKGTYFKALPHGGPVQAVSICSTNGLIATASGSTVRLWSINGKAIALVSTSAKEPIVSLAFLEQESEEEDDAEHQDTLCVLFTGHRGKFIPWSCKPRKRTEEDDTRQEKEKEQVRWVLEPGKVYEHNERLSSATIPLITAIKSKDNMIITGDDFGRLFLWTLPGQAVEVPHSLWSVCMQCQRKVGVFEKRVSCGACGGLFCNACVEAVDDHRFGNARFCLHCRARLGL